MNITRKFALLLGAAVLAAGAAHAEPTVVRIASHVSEFSPLHAQSKMFADEVNKRLPGQFEFQLFPSGQLGNEKALLANVQAGAIEMVNIASGVLKLDKKLGVFDLPWLFSDRAHVQRAMKGGLEDAVRTRIEEIGGVKVVGVYENGFRHVMNSKRAIQKPEDLEGLKVRISGGKFRQTVFKQMGATPQSVPWGETFTALQTGVVDGAEAATYGFYEQKHFEAAGYLSLTSHVYTPSFLMMSKRFNDSLTDAQRKVFFDVGREITDATYAQAAELEARYFKEIKAHAKINEVDLAAFQAATGKAKSAYESDFEDDYLKFVTSTQSAQK